MIDKYYDFLSIFGDCQELAVFAIRDLTDCNYRTAKIRTIITNPRFEGSNENFSEIEKYIDDIYKLIEFEYDIKSFCEKYNDVNDDDLFKLEGIDEIGLEKFKDEMSLLNIEDRKMEYLYFRECSIKEKANKEIFRLKEKVQEKDLKLDRKNEEINKLKNKIQEIRNEKYSQSRLF
jgi:hypothetical protein